MLAKHVEDVCSVGLVVEQMSDVLELLRNFANRLLSAVLQLENLSRQLTRIYHRISLHANGRLFFWFRWRFVGNGFQLEMRVLNKTVNLSSS